MGLAEPGGMSGAVLYEDIADGIVAVLQRRGWVRTTSTTSWESFARLSDLVHRSFEVPSTSFTPIMRRLLFALSSAARPAVVVGVGTYVGYTFAWLLGDRSDHELGPLFGRAEGIDVDPHATEVARVNCRVLGHGRALSFRTADGVEALGSAISPIDLLYIDVDSPSGGKSAYRDVLAAAHWRLRPGSLILAHDPCVPKFDSAFKRYHDYISGSVDLEEPLVLAVDCCGLSVSVARHPSPAIRAEEAQARRT